jgi:hypothetical protein
MGKRNLIVAVLLGAAYAGAAFAQEHYTEGPAWSCSAYRTEPGRTDDDLRYLLENFVPTSDEAKKQGLVLDTKVFMHAPSTPEDWDVLICITAKRLEMRKFLWTRMHREIALRPM